MQRRATLKAGLGVPASVHKAALLLPQRDRESAYLVPPALLLHCNSSPRDSIPPYHHEEKYDQQGRGQTESEDSQGP